MKKITLNSLYLLLLLLLFACEHSENDTVVLQTSSHDVSKETAITVAQNFLSKYNASFTSH